MIWWGILGICLVVGLAYTIIPDFLLHRMGIGSWKRQYSSGVALTFDDGPHPEYTPKVLDLLDRYNVPATFFVLGEKAVEYPEIIEAITRRGHQIGLHGQHHLYAWFLNPVRTWQNWEEGAATLEQLTGRQVEFFRPPWGTFNLAVWWWAKHRKKRAVLWNVEGQDWKVSRTPGQIAQGVLSKTREGSIVVLHDGGGEPRAPENTIGALETICHTVLEVQKLPFVKLEFPEWRIWRRTFYVLWDTWERLFSRLHKVQRISSSNLFRLSRTRYTGPDLYSDNGSLLATTGDTVAEIHFDNVRLLGKETDSQRMGLKVLRQAKESLPGLAGFVADNPDYAGIQVFLGLTLIHRGVKGFGFQVQEVPTSVLTRVVGQLQGIIMRVYHPAGNAKTLTRSGTHPKLVWMSREQLLQRWLPAKDVQS